MTARIYVPIEAQRTWQRKWRDVLAAREDLAEAYATRRLDVDDLTRRVENFFKTCRELADWIYEETNKPAIKHIHNCSPTKPSALKLCDAIAQTAKHFKRRPNRRDPDPITSVAVKLHGTSRVKSSGTSADINWSSKAASGRPRDALRLADQCLVEWRRFFRAHKLDPRS